MKPKLNKKVMAALKEAKRLEKENLLSDKKVVAVYKEGLSTLDKLKKFLKPAWFVGKGRKK